MVVASARSSSGSGGGDGATTLEPGRLTSRCLLAPLFVSLLYISDSPYLLFFILFLFSFRSISLIFCSSFVAVACCSPYTHTA